MLKGVERKVVSGGEMRKGSREDGGLEKKEIRRAGSLKDRKAIGIEVPSEVWKYGGGGKE